MSGLNYVSLIDPRVDINNLKHKTYGILRGGSHATYKKIVASSKGDTGISFTADPPSEKVFVGRRLLMETKHTLTFTGTSPAAGVHLIQMAGAATAPGVNAGVYNWDAPRCAPQSEMIKTINCTMNSHVITTSLNTYSRLFQRFGRTADEEDRELSLAPAYPDQSQSYDDLDGYPRSALSAYGDSDLSVHRGGFQGVRILRNDSTGTAADVAIVELTVTEPIYLSPWAYGRNMEEVGFIRLETMQIDLTLGGRGQGPLGGLGGALWSHAPKGSVLTSVAATVDQAYLYMCCLSPDIAQEIPNDISYAYYKTMDFPTQYDGLIAPGQQVEIVSSDRKMNDTPARVLLHVSEKDINTNITSTNSYFRIDQISISYKNEDSLLNGMSPQDLYLMYLRAGGNMSWTMWSKVGSIVPVCFGTDLPLDPFCAPGLKEQANFQVTVKATNISTRNITPTLHVTFINEGVCRITDGVMSVSEGVLTVQDIEQARYQEPMSFRPVGTFHGGGIMSDFGNFIKKLVRPGINAARSVVGSVAPQFLPIVEGASEVASSYGLGLGRRRGGQMIGGALISNSEMKQLTY